jgi:thiol-disulfide isomerase/thioredoxin
MYYRLLLTALFFLLARFAQAQQFSLLETPKPEVGKPCPEFALTHVTHYAKNNVTLNDFKGKWLFLDFWFTGCTTCIYSFPKINALQKHFSEEIQFLLVGQNHRKYYKNVEQVFEKLSVSKGLDIACAYDSTLAQSWGIRSMPHIVIIDPQGIVRYITDGSDMTIERIQDLLDGKTVNFYSKDVKVGPEFNSRIINGDGNSVQRNSILSNSILTKWGGEKPEAGLDVEQYTSYPPNWERGFRVVGVSLEWLYTLAYFGKNSGMLKFWGNPLYGLVYPFPVLDLQNTDKFHADFSSGTGLYNYCITVPSEQITNENFMQFMQQDLKRVFGYSAVIEEREMPVWELIAKPGAQLKLKTKGGLKYYTSSEGSVAAGFTVRNVPMKGFFTNLCYYLSEKEKHPFIDSTGISDNIDFTIDADMTNFDHVRKELQKNGLDFILSKKKMKVLVIRDPEKV